MFPCSAGSPAKSFNLFLLKLSSTNAAHQQFDCGVVDCILPTAAHQSNVVQQMLRHEVKNLFKKLQGEVIPGWGRQILTHCTGSQAWMTQAKLAHWNFWEISYDVFTDSWPTWIYFWREQQQDSTWVFEMFSNFWKKQKWNQQQCTAYRFFLDFGIQIKKYFSGIRYFGYNCEVKKGKRENSTSEIHTTCKKF